MAPPSPASGYGNRRRARGSRRPLAAFTTELFRRPRAARSQALLIGIFRWRADLRGRLGTKMLACKGAVLAPGWGQGRRVSLAPPRRSRSALGKTADPCFAMGNAQTEAANAERKWNVGVSRDRTAEQAIQRTWAGGLRGDFVRGGAERVCGADRTVRLRQVDATAHRLWPVGADLRHGASQRRDGDRATPRNDVCFSTVY